MFAVIYRFHPKVGREADFETEWHAGTTLIRAERGSLGSRLHRSPDGGYMAYAQWPSRDAWKNPPPASTELRDTLARMNACLSESEVKAELEVIDDLLV